MVSQIFNVFFYGRRAWFAAHNCCHMNRFWWQCQYLLVYVKRDTLIQLKSSGWLNHEMTTHMSDRWGSPSLPLCWNILLLFHMSLTVNFKTLQVWFWGLPSVPSRSLSSVILAAWLFGKKKKPTTINFKLDHKFDTHKYIQISVYKKITVCCP